MMLKGYHTSTREEEVTPLMSASFFINFDAPFILLLHSQQVVFILHSSSTNNKKLYEYLH